MKKQNGITLIALVISIIVMLILAGVSINAVVGDNGVIGKAQEALYLQSCAVLEEFLQMEASNYALEENPYKTQYGLLKAKHPGWFYQNAQGYILDSDGHVMYLIKKSGLPQEIQDQITGGDANKVSQYYKQVDVYGVTSDLQVYYCNNGTDTILGLTTEDLDKDNPLEIAYDEDSLLSKVINGTNAEGKANEALSEQDLKSIKSLTIDTTEKLALLNEFIKLPSLQTVYFSGIIIPSLNGIQNAPSITEVRFTSCTVNDYSALCGLTKLNKLYLITPAGKNTDVATLCSSDKGIATAEFSNLQYLGIVGNATYLQSTSKDYSGARYDVTDVSGLANLSKTTKESINYMYLQNLQLTSIASLSEFINVSVIRLEYNALTTFEGIQNMSKLLYLIAPVQYSDVTSSYTLGTNETATQNVNTDALSYIYKDVNGKNTTLYYVDIRNANNLKWTSYLATCSGIKYLYMDSNTAIKDSNTIANVIGNCGTNYTLPSKFTTSIIANNSVKLDLTSQTITESQFRALKNNTKLSHLNLYNTVITNDDVSALTNEEYTELVNEILSTCTNMQYLSLYGQSKLTNIDFVSNMINLKELNLVNVSNVSDISVLETQTNNNSNFRLGTLFLNNVNIDLSTIQNTISNLGEVRSVWTQYSVGGLIIYNRELLDKLSVCKNITQLTLYNGYANQYSATISKYTGEIDISECTLLKSLVVYQVGCSFKLPSSLTNYQVAWNTGISDLSNCSLLEKIHYSDSTMISKISTELATIPENCTTLHTIEMCVGTENKSEDFEFLACVSDCTNLKNIIIRENTVDGWRALYIDSPTGIRHLKNLESVNIGFSNKNQINKMKLPDLTGLTNLKSFTVSNGNVYDITNAATYTSLTGLHISNGSFSNLNALSNLTNLTSVTLTNNKIINVYGLANLENLTYLNLNNNNINDVKPLENLKKLETLYLQNNALYDNSYDSTGKSYYTLTVFSDLNQNQDGSLKNLYLDGNNIEDFSMLQDSNLKWDEKSGW